jgi:phospholipid N-methyltransferase
MLKELIKHPRDICAISPSSEALAKEMARALTPGMMGSGTFIELGAGTGPVPKALIGRGVPPDSLLVFEKSESLADCLSRRFPGVRVLCRGAEDMGRYVDGASPVRAIISSLPFRSLPEDVSVAIMSEVERVLAPGGLYIQFTYALIGDLPFVPASFRKVRSRLVLFNIPPAKVAVFCKPAAPDRAGDVGVD